MRQNTKIRGVGDILRGILILSAITMPLLLHSQPLPEKDHWVVVIDAGHGGKDPGALGSKAREKNINLAVALKTGNYITSYLNDVRVIYTRSDDTFIGLAERTAIANRHKADLFISIHSNAMDDKRFTGAETYVLGHTNDEANLKVAMKENSVITFEQDYQTKYAGFDPNSAESYIIFSLMQNTYLKQSTEFATLVQDQFRERVGRKDRGVRQAGFQVLRENAMPSVLIELAFITNPDEEKFLMSEQGQDYMASAIFRAFREYKQTIDSRSGIKNGSGITASRSGTPESMSTITTQEKRPDQQEITAAAGNSATRDRESSPERKEEQAAGRGDENGGIDAAQPVKNVAEATSDDDILFMVQIAAVPVGRELGKSRLEGIEPVTLIEDGGRIKYAAGKFVIYDDALRERRSLTARFPDAFVIALRGGKIIPLREAIEAKRRK